MFNLILWASIIWLAPLVTRVMANDAVFKKNLVVGVTFPQAAREDPELKQILLDFKRRLKYLGWILVLLALPAMLIQDFGISFSIWLIWLVLVLILPHLVYVRTNLKLKELKQAGAWQVERQPLYVDTRAVDQGKWLSPLYFLPAFILALIPAIMAEQIRLVCSLMAAFNILAYLGYRYLYRNKSEMIDQNLDLTKVLTQVRRRNWSRLWLYIAYGNAAYCLSMWLMLRSVAWATALFILVTLGLVIISLRIELKTRKIQEKLSQASGSDWYVDEDDYWKGGIFYYNPNDHRLIVNQRVGIKSSLNLARPAGKLIMGLASLVLLACLAVGPIISYMNGAELDLKLKDNRLQAGQAWTKYDLDLADLDRVDLIWDLPPGLMRVAGTGLPDLMTGKWTAKAYPKLRLCLDPGRPPFILVQTKASETYILGLREAAETEQVYQEIKALLAED